MRRIITALLTTALLLTAAAPAGAVSRVGVRECKDALRGAYYTSPDLNLPQWSDNDIRKFRSRRGFEAWRWARTSIGTAVTQRYGRYRLVVYLDFWQFQKDEDAGHQQELSTPGYCARTTSGRINDSVGQAPPGW